VERYDPDLWTDEFAFLNQPGQVEIQTDLFYDYRTNIDAYPKWQAWMREKQPSLLVIWGKDDPALRMKKYAPHLLRALDLENYEAVYGKHFLQEDSSPAIAS
jgi:hypothetical protein